MIGSMTVPAPRGFRRGLERHQTLRHAVPWSYDLLDDTEKALLERCSVFAGGFDLAKRLRDSKIRDVDDLAILDLLGALVRKSLLVADRSRARTRFSMLETIRKFAEEQLVARGEAPTSGRTLPALRRTGNDMLARWDGPRQREAYTWFTTDSPTCAPHSAGLPPKATLTARRRSPSARQSSALWSNSTSPLEWAEELIESARSVNHRRLADLYAVTAQCYAAGRLDDAVGYLDAQPPVNGERQLNKILYEFQNSTGVVDAHAGQSGRWAELCRSAIEQEHGSSNGHPCISGYGVLLLR